MTAPQSISPDIVEALKHYAEQYCEGWCRNVPPECDFADCGGCRARLTLATLPDEAAKRTPLDLDGPELNQIATEAFTQAAARAQAARTRHAFRKNPHSAADFCALCGKPENLHDAAQPSPSPKMVALASRIKEAKGIQIWEQIYDPYDLHFAYRDTKHTLTDDERETLNRALALTSTEGNTP